jgi:hypothetical protein
MTRQPSMGAKDSRGRTGYAKHDTRAFDRLTASFEYVGPALDAATGRAVLGTAA